MIKISLNNEVAVLKFHYENLTVQTGREWTVVVRIQRLIDKHAATPSLVAMYTFLLQKVLKDAVGFSILTATPRQLKAFIEEFEFNHLASILVSRDNIENIFYYSDYDKWSAYEIAKKIGLNVCPYCNRTYTFTLGNDIDKGVRFEFDHFYAQAKYPYLALSFFNLIPSCHICNSNLKGKAEFTIDTHLHPYLEGFSDNILFSIKPMKAAFINGDASAYTIKFKRGVNSTWSRSQLQSAIRNIQTFRLVELYNIHKDYVDELIKKSIVYSPAYVSNLFLQFQGTLFKSREDVERLVVGTYTTEDDYKLRVLSKLSTDISKELGLL